MDNRPIGIFDSGVGGLTVYKEIRKRFPSEHLIYFGDTARVPYGPKSTKTVIDYSVQNARFLAAMDVKLIIVACNTSSAVAMDILTEHFKIPVIGVIQPGAEKAVKATQNNRIGVIGTEGTINSSAYKNAMQKLSSGLTVISRACPLFVPIAEEGWQDHISAGHIADEYLAPFVKEQIDTLVLGCTHYPVLKETIRKSVGNKVGLIDSAEAISEYLAVKGLCDETNKREKGSDQFFVSDNEDKFRLLASRILDSDIEPPVRVRLGESWFVE